MDTDARYEDTRGYRIFLIRQARGTVKKPMPQRQFAELLRGVRGRNYDASEVSVWENNKAQPSLDDAMDLAAVDPQQRGLTWLITGMAEPETTTPPQSEAAQDDAAARREAEAARVAASIRLADQQHAAKKRQRRAKGGGGV